MMKSDYRQAVESLIAQEAKLAEVIELHAKAAAREKQLSEAVTLCKETLLKYESRVCEIETSSAS